MKFLTIQNLVASVVEERNPWEHPSNPPESVGDSKTAFIQWCRKPSTRACIWSLYEGLNANLRVTSDSNIAYQLHGFVADYDTALKDSDLAGLPGRATFEYMPTWSCRTFSGGARLVWDFEAPLLLSSRATTKVFLRIAARKMGLNKLLPGFDAPAFTTIETYYEAGRDWQKLSADRIPLELLWLWMAEAGAASASPVGATAVPLAEVKKELDAKFPDRWRGPFELGARGVRFWDPLANNPTAAVVRETGMQCFTGPQGFVSWAEIFGHSFVEKFDAAKIGALLQHWWFDGRQYWFHDADRFIPFAKDDFRLAARVKYGLSASTPKGETCSELDQVTFEIQMQKRIVAAMPRVHFPPGVYYDRGQQFLNTICVKCIEPAEATGLEWGEGFPWLAEFLEYLFVNTEQFNHFLGWLQWFYLNGYEMTPQSGQAVFLAGGASVGKTLLSTGIVSRLVGGHQDAREYLLGEAGRFTDYLFEVPLLTMDDATPASNARLHERFSAGVKRLCANEYHFYDKKFGSAGQVSWLGRIMVTCNLDPESIRILPSLEMSTLDKISLFRVAREPIEFPRRQVLKQTIDAELPFLARWLLEWELPDDVRQDARFGVVAYHDPDLLESASQSEQVSSFGELVDEFRVRYWLSTRSAEWVGTSTALLAIVAATPDLEKVARGFMDSRVVSRNLGKLCARGEEYLSYKKSTGARVWTIICHPDSFPTYLAEHLRELTGGKDERTWQ